MASSWLTKSSKVVYENPWMVIHEDQVVQPNGKDGTYGVVSSKSDAVFVVPIDADGNTYIIRQEHYTTRQLDWQCVAGRTDGEMAEVAAKRELLEEAGLRAESITVLSSAKTAAGMTTFKSTLCLARNLQFDDSLLDKEEGITEIKKISLDTAKEMIFSGEIANTESIATLLLAITYLEKERTV
jgi:8-oxo-dGTP pyrophosphatase MutT (NUDIX family)